MDEPRRFAQLFAQCPLVAIIRGVQPDEAVGIGAALVESGFGIIEVPLNSPDPLVSIERLAKVFGDRAMIGAGTVLDPADVPRIASAGGRLIVAPNCNPAVIQATLAAGLVAAPGFFTPSEAFTAIEAGAHALKLFPAEAASPAVVKAQRAVLPAHVPLLVVGGVTPESIAAWLAAGADGFGLGGALYRPGMFPAEVAARAESFVTALARRSS